MNHLIPPLRVLDLDFSTGQDSAYVTLDLSGVVPPGATQALLQFNIFNGTGPSDSALLIRYRPIGDTFGGVNHDGSMQFSSVGSDTNYVCQNAWVRVGSDRKIQYRRYNPHSKNTIWCIDLLGWQGGYAPLSVGGADVVVPFNGVNNYPSFPWAYTSRTGDRFIIYFDWDGTHAASHDTNLAAWQIKNDGAPVQLWNATGINGATATPDGYPVYDVFTMNPPGSRNLVALMRTANLNFYYAESSDGGATWSRLVAQPAFVGLPLGSSAYIFFDFLPSLDGTKILGSLYLIEDGVVSTNQSSALMESTDGVHWTFRSWIARFTTQAVPANETGLVRMPSGRIIAAMRNSTVAGTNGFTSYSDDDGATWSTPLQINAHFQGIRGKAFGDKCVICGRDSTPANGYPVALWTLDSNGALLWGPVGYFRNTFPSDGGYATFSDGPNGTTQLWFYSDLNDINGIGPNLCRTSISCLAP